MKHECPKCGCKFSEAVLSERDADGLEPLLKDIPLEFSAVPEAGAHDAILEAAAVLCETNNLLSGSNGPLMDHGWKCCQQACADGIRKMKRSPPQEHSK